MHPEIAIVWADSAYAGKLVEWAKKYLDVTIKTVRRPPDAKGFVVLPRRWVVERSRSWIMRARRHCRDHERLPEMSESLMTWAAITLMTPASPAAKPGPPNGATSPRTTWYRPPDPCGVKGPSPYGRLARRRRSSLRRAMARAIGPITPRVTRVPADLQSAPVDSPATTSATRIQLRCPQFGPGPEAGVGCVRRVVR